MTPPPSSSTTPTSPRINIYFSEYFGIDPAVLERYGAFNVSLINDLPLFIDPFLLFNSTNPEYQNLHKDIIRYLRFLRDKARAGEIDEGLLRAWFRFPEVRQTWLGFSVRGNSGSGLGEDFARSLSANLGRLFSDFGGEKVTKGSHLEKLCLLAPGVGRDNISDFTTNLIKGFLLAYTQAFAQKSLRPDQRRAVRIPKVSFNYVTESWESQSFEIPYIGGDYVILTPRDILTKDETWINRDDLIGSLDDIVDAVTDTQLRAQVSNYLEMQLAREPDEPEPSQKERRAAAASALVQFPGLLDHYIRWKEDHGSEATELSKENVASTEQVFIRNVKKFVGTLATTEFYSLIGNTFDEARARVLFLKSVIEDQGGHRLFYDSRGEPIRRESDLQIFYRLTWFGTPSDVNREVNNGRGPVDFAVSRGAADKSLVEFKLAKNTKLEKNLQNQVAIYERAGQTRKSLTVIVYFTEEEMERAQRILTKLDLSKDPNIIMIDARSDNKPSASTA
jgi:hypothetical protein